MTTPPPAATRRATPPGQLGPPPRPRQAKRGHCDKVGEPQDCYRHAEEVRLGGGGDLGAVDDPVVRAGEVAGVGVVRVRQIARDRDPEHADEQGDRRCPAGRLPARGAATLNGLIGSARGSGDLSLLTCGEAG